jgi:Z1 domain
MDRNMQIVLRTPDAVAMTVRSGAAVLQDLHIGARVSKLTGRDLDAWMGSISSDEREQLMRRLAQLVVILDEAPEAPIDAPLWPNPMTEGRREAILKALGLSEEIARELDARNPLPARIGASPLVWVDPDFRPEQSEGYLNRTCGPRWKRYKNHLTHRMIWRSSDVASLEEDLDELVAAFPDPALGIRMPRRLLVVGYTQSGKTANFLGLAARMADAGTRLVIILSGRTKILRRQTQARVDRDLVGADPQNLGLLGGEYGMDHRLLSRLSDIGPDWEDEHGWVRQTQVSYGRSAGTGGGPADDDAYVRPQGGLAERTRPIIAVLKKTPGDLQTFIDALAAASPKFRRLPALVIDEEADDASLNYKQKGAAGGGWAPPRDEDRSKVNLSISQMLGQLEAGIYVGYTATPFANCFADANDPRGFFPHAIQVLKTPTGYFGANRVFDVLYDGPECTFRPKAAHIREVGDEPDNHADLDHALDDYLIAGAVKLFRIQRARQLGDDAALQRLRHHTMMVHVHRGRQAHRVLVDELTRRLFDRPGRGIAIIAPQRTAERLRERYEKDFLPRSKDLIGTAGRIPTPELDLSWIPSWKQLEPFVIEAVARLVQLQRDGSVVLLVNSDEDRQTPEYDTNSPGDPDAATLGRWCVLVGGLMLSRGFTVEGLTTVYFRRVASAMDTQLQLARWNGYRSYFEDLIRIYFGIAEPGSKVNPVRNLYEEFQESAHKDALFRERLRRYAEEGTSPRIELPTFPDQRTDYSLPPTAAGKRRGVVELRGGPIELGKHGTGIPHGASEIADLATHWGTHTFASVPVCEACQQVGRSGAIMAATGDVTADEVRKLLEAMLGSGAVGLSTEEEEAIHQVHQRGGWRVAVIGTTTAPKLGNLPFSNLAVPVRQRKPTEDPTLSTGDWNRWIRAQVGDKCDGQCNAPVRDQPPILVLLPYDTLEDGSPKRWGAIIQIHGRTARGRQLVVRPSAAPR